MANLSEHPPTCVLHIGKTGGSYMRSLLRHNETRWTRPLHLLGHGGTLRGSAKRFGDDRRLAFVVRDPVTRFVSAFYSRQRQGRPTYQVDWTPEEAAAFLWFEHAEDLALALRSDVPRARSAALYAMGAIQHLQRDLRFHLGGPEQLLAERDNIAVCVDLDRLDTHTDDIMERLGVPDYQFPLAPRRHASPAPLPALSPDAEAALRAHWEEEFELYSVALSIAEQLGLG
ncbi:sulfotransferase family protein [Litoreibacter ponti]|uniref:Sulfotransferase family protein n=1 Tax=Litoreibacter ponti TaxID=1510457 RepID=A0A2T6BN42_9RHOB|nr:sulfotransferase family 2 domain-containing protein [Litoreibacter ponti]PTX57481.1 sulfotransferase family protein [Litoreibacter ponti]